MKFSTLTLKEIRGAERKFWKDREKILKLLGISNKEYIELKKKFNEQLEKFILMKKKRIDRKIKSIK